VRNAISSPRLARICSTSRGNQWHACLGDFGLYRIPGKLRGDAHAISLAPPAPQGHQSDAIFYRKANGPAPGQTGESLRVTKFPPRMTTERES